MSNQDITNILEIFNTKEKKLWQNYRLFVLHHSSTQAPGKLGNWVGKKRVMNLLIFKNYSTLTRPTLTHLTDQIIKLLISRNVTSLNKAGSSTNYYQILSSCPTHGRVEKSDAMKDAGRLRLTHYHRGGWIETKQNEWDEYGMVEWNLWQEKTGETPRKSI